MVGLGAALLLGYAVVKALTERPCPYCKKSTPKNQPQCVHCHSMLGGWP